MAKHRQAHTTESNNELLWGVPAIAAAINRTTTQTYYLIEQGHLEPAVKKLGHRTIVASRQGLRALFALPETP